MKWFKHMSQSNADERLADYLSECGLEGYGFWWLLMEVVAAQCVGDKCSATYPLPQWSRLLYCHHNKVGKYLGKLGVIGIVKVESVEGKIRVTIPNLLKYRDEYSKKSGQNPDRLRSKKEKEKEKEKENKEESTPPTPSMTLFEIRAAYREQTGVEPGGGVNQNLSEICQTYTREAITEALLATGTRTPKPTNPFKYFLRTLQGQAHGRASPDDFDPTKDYPAGSFFALLKAEHEEEQREHQLRSSST